MPQMAKKFLRESLNNSRSNLNNKVSGQMMKFFKINASNDLFYKMSVLDHLDNKKIKNFAN